MASIIATEAAGPGRDGIRQGGIDAPPLEASSAAPRGTSNHGRGLGRPYWLAAGAVLLGGILAVGLLLWEPFSPSQRLVLAVAAATAAAALSVPTGMFLLANHRHGEWRSDLDAGVIVLILAVGWLLPTRLVAMLSPSAAHYGIHVGFGVAIVVLFLAASTRQDSEHREVPSRLLLVLVAAVLTTTALLLTEAFSPQSMATTIQPVAAIVFAIAAVIMLLKGYRSERWSLTFIGMQLFCVQISEIFVARADEVTSAAWLGACLLAAVGAGIGSAGALAVAKAASEASRQKLIDASVSQVQMLQLQDVNEERMHDLRSGLLSVEAFAGSLRQQPGRAEVPSVDLLVAELARLRSIIATERGPVELVDLSGGLHQLVAARTSLGEAITSGVAHGIGVVGDRSQILDVVQNLIDNAERHAPGAEVFVGAELRDQAAVITVLDNGPGFTEAQLPRVFERGFTTHRQGSGLGLHIARQAVESMGGSVAAMNDPRGGARLEVRLPGRSLTAQRADEFAD